jgi:hypothetical protein
MESVVGGIYILQSSTTADGPWLNENIGSWNFCLPKINDGTDTCFWK